MRLVCINKPTREYSVLIHDYEKRLTKYVNFEVIELKNDKDIEKHLKGKIIILEEEHGKQLTSSEFATLLEPNTTFVIGGPEGLPEHIKKKGQNISLGKITLPHQLARLVLTEQIYRGYTILKKEPYHKN